MSYITKSILRLMMVFTLAFSMSGSVIARQPQNDLLNETVSVAERIEFLRNTTSFADNIIVGTPIEKVQGASKILDYTQQGCEIILTDYYFKVTNWVFGMPGEEIIRVRSQVGNVFEIGSEYTFAAMRLYSVFFDQYNVNSHNWILRNEDASESELVELHNNLNRIRANQFNQHIVITEAVPSIEFMQNVDVAIIATVTATLQDELDNDNIDALLELREVVYGEINMNVLNEFMRLRGNVVVGNEYLILFHVNEHGILTLVAREGAVIPINTVQFNNFIDVIYSAY